MLPLRPLALSLALILCSAPVLAEVVFEQLPGDEGYYSDLKVAPTSGQQLEADNFMLDQTCEITRVEWWAWGQLEFFTDFWIRIFAHGSGVPGDLLYSGMHYGVFHETDGDFTRYQLEIDGPLVAAGTAYWFAVAGINDYTGDPTWDEIFHWALAAGGEGYARQFGPEAGWAYAEFRQPAFRLSTGTSIDVEPSSWGQVKSLYR